MLRPVCSTDEVRGLLTVLGGVVAVWVVFVVTLWAGGRDRATLMAASRLLPDTVRLIGRLARDRTTLRSARWELWLVLAYLALPIDLVPDFLPVIGYADDAILVSLVLRRLIRRSGSDAIVRHWPGSDEGLDVLRRVFRIS